jgi:hypothetical protein
MDDTRAALTVRRLRWVFVGLVLTWLGCEAAALAGYSESPLQLACINLLIQPHLPIALAGVVVFYFCSQPGSRECLATVTLGAVLALGLKLLDGLGRWTTPLPYCLCFGLGSGSLVALAWRAWRCRGGARQRVLAVLLPACLVLGSVPLIFFFLILTIQLRPQTYDALAYAADGTLGVQVSFALGRLFAAVPMLATVSLLVYCTLPLAFMVLLVLHVRGQGPPVYDLLPSFLCVAVSGFLTYMIFPLTGPLFVFGDAFPNAPPVVASVLAGPLSVPDVPRNCMPSLHTAWALLLWWHARPLGRLVRWGAGVWLAFTVLATLGFGAHYAFDVVVAFPSALACRAVCMQMRPKLTAYRQWTVVWGVLLTATWLMLLRHGLGLLEVSPWLTTSAALSTIGFALAREESLHDMAACGLESTGEAPLPRSRGEGRAAIGAPSADA